MDRNLIELFQILCWKFFSKVTPAALRPIPGNDDVSFIQTDEN